MKRKLFSSIKSCPLGCKYCFAKAEIYSSQELYTNNLDNNEYDIFYPSCDSELFYDNNILNTLDKNIHLDKHYRVLSVSTKLKLDKIDLIKISEINDYLIKNNKGFVKFSVSITNMSMIKEIEPNCANFDERLRILKESSDLKLNTSVVIKPILPFISFKEYKKIIAEISNFTDLVLLGDLYVFPGTEFYAKYIENKYEITDRVVNWLDDNPVWKVVVDEKLKQSIISELEKRKMHVFHCDVDLIGYIKNKLFMQSRA